MFAFGYISLAITATIVWFMPKHLTKQEIYITWLILSGLTVNTDLVFGFVFDLYDFVDEGIPLKDLFLQWFLPPSFGIIFLNFMPLKRSSFMWYLAVVVLISVFFEALSLQFHYLVYKGWSLWYSAIIYFLGMIYLRWHLFFIRSR